MSQKQTIITVISLLVILLIVIMFAKPEPGGEQNDQAGDTAQSQADEYSRTVQLISVNSQTIVVEVAVPVVNELGIAEAESQRRNIELTANTVISLQGESATRGALTPGQNIVVFTAADLVINDNQQAIRIDIQ